jgi:hypothetical protein
MSEEESKETVQGRLELLTALNEERNCNDKRYAIKLVEVVVWAMVGIILTSFLLGIAALVISTAQGGG